MSKIRITFQKDFEKYNGKYKLYDLDDEKRMNFKVIFSREHGYSLLIDEGEKKYMVIDPKTNEILFFEKTEDLESVFFSKEYKDYRMTEKFLFKELRNYKTTEVGVKRIIKSLFKTIYEGMDFDEKMEYMKSSSNRNIEGLKGVTIFNNINIKLTSKFDERNQILNCDCTVVTAEGGDIEFMYGLNNDYKVGYLFMFDDGYIEIIYEKTIDDHDLGYIFEPLYSKIVIGDESFDGFFNPFGDQFIKDDFKYERELYEFMDGQRNEGKQLEFIIGLEIPKIIEENDYYGDSYYDYDDDY